MSDYMTHAPRGLGGELGYTHVRTHSEAQWQDVRHHPRRASRSRRHTTGEWNIDNDVLRPRQTVHKNGRSGDDELRQAHARAMRDRVQVLDARKWQKARMTNEAVGRRPRALS